MNEWLLKVKEVRKEKGISQEYMAIKLGISQSAYSKKERGVIAMSGFDNLAISEILEVNPKSFH